jgi:hypothetical protein
MSADSRLDCTPSRFTRCNKQRRVTDEIHGNSFFHSAIVQASAFPDPLSTVFYRVLSR